MSFASWSFGGILMGGGLLIAVGSIAYLVVVIACLLNFKDEAFPSTECLPGLTVLKPLCGDEPHLETALRSFCRQDYPGQVQIIFGVRCSDDPALGIARRLKHEFSDCAIDIVINPSVHGPNLKVSNLVNMSALALHEIIVVSDSDVIVGPGCLSRLAESFVDSTVGAATCLFRGCPAEQDSLVGQLGALYIDAWFFPAAVVDAALFSQSVCYGPVTAIRRKVLEAGGGFEALTHVLADDTELGHLTTRAGQRIALVPIAVDTIIPENDLVALCLHELRWARTTRALRPGSYAVSVLTHALPITILLCLAAPGPGTGFLLGTVVALRGIVLALIQFRFGRAVSATWPAPWTLVGRECLYFGIWVVGFFGHAIVWRGRDLRILPGARVAADQILSSSSALQPGEVQSS